MNISQIKSDMENGILISRDTWVKLVEVALAMESFIDYLQSQGTEWGNQIDREVRTVQEACK